MGVQVFFRSSVSQFWLHCRIYIYTHIYMGIKEIYWGIYIYIYGNKGKIYLNSGTVGSNPEARIKMLTLYLGGISQI